MTSQLRASGDVLAAISPRTSSHGIIDAGVRRNMSREPFPGSRLTHVDRPVRKPELFPRNALTLASCCAMLGRVLRAHTWAPRSAAFVARRARLVAVPKRTMKAVGVVATRVEISYPAVNTPVNVSAMRDSAAPARCESTAVAIAEKKRNRYSAATETTICLARGFTRLMVALRLWKSGLETSNAQIFATGCSIVASTVARSLAMHR